MQPRLVSVNFRLSSPDLALDVQVRLCELDGRWLAVADFGDEPEVGLGASARAALAAALSTLGPRAATALMADPELFGVSVELVAGA
jgi:microcystin degradation protein MlrC